MRKICTACFLFAISMTWPVFAAENDDNDDTRDLVPLHTALRRAGAVSYSHKGEFSRGISDLYLGYDAQGRIVAGAARANLKSYEKVTAVVVVARDGKGYRIHRIRVPDVEKIKNRGKQGKVKKTANAFAGKRFLDAKGRKHEIDAVSGATHIQRRLYSDFNSVTQRVIHEMEAGHEEWEKIHLPTPVSDDNQAMQENKPANE